MLLLVMHKSKTGRLPVSGAGRSALIEEQVCELLAAFRLGQNVLVSAVIGWLRFAAHPPQAYVECIL